MGLPNDVWETGAGAILVSADFRHLWRRMGSAMGVEDPAVPDMDLDAKIAARRARTERFFAEMPDWPTVEAAMAAMNIAWGQLRHGADLRDQPTLRHRGSIVEIDDREGGVRPIPQSPYRFSEARSGVRGVAPHRGEHNTEVLQEWLGLDPTAVSDLRSAGVLDADPA